MMEATKCLCQSKDKCDTKVFIFDGWFYSTISDEAENYFGAELIDILKTNTKFLKIQHQGYNEGLARRLLPGFQGCISS